MACDVLIFGGVGDLAYRKLYPSLYKLDKNGSLPEGLRIFGVSRREIPEEEFLTEIRQGISRNEDIDADAWQSFLDRLQLVFADATVADDLRPIKEQYFSDGSRELMVYLATPPNIFAPICQSMAAVGLNRPSTRIVVEKPLGDDRESFREINCHLTEIFDESQVYRIDHYLGKEAVQNLLALRFANALFEPLWNNNYIDHIQITVAETVGVEGRWGFYDEAGAMRDMVQNHLLQLLCLTAMEPPAELAADAVRDEKLKVLRCLKPIVASNLKETVVRGQYAAGAVAGEPVPGYRQEEGAAQKSDTETFVALKAEVDNWRWAGVPFYLRTGKRLPMRYSEIVIQFKEIPHSIFSGSTSEPNRLTIRLQPNDSIQLSLMSKVPGLKKGMDLKAVPLDLFFSEIFAGEQGVSAYERLLLDVINSNPTLFVRSDEVEAAWTWVDGIRSAWQEVGQNVAQYTAGSWGPTAAIALLAKDDRQWYEDI
ncbi:glucose-6-phosphate dehydrogenase [Porticoccus sp. W117]|uniref:glucose-6-phosphate dehydrogenase n=1 Tax=Porticoccus sp. W117 TaxID=3054777 RepID=UPI00259A881E|nr:glucose-6-phosphate dehydrogenase [Porticoccus sp. W117]MDM3870046.1 glucose-6-phosphate dehydrogenase [Porticoccus sp. W117]